MSEIRADASRPGSFLISGELVFDTVPELFEQSRNLLTAADNPIELDFHGVAKADSAGLALLIEWMRIARRKQSDIVFKNIPDQLLSIARVSGVHDVLPLGDGGRSLS